MCILVVRAAEQFLSLFVVGPPLGGQFCILLVRIAKQFLSACMGSIMYAFVQGIHQYSHAWAA